MIRIQWFPLSISLSLSVSLMMKYEWWMMNDHYDTCSWSHQNNVLVGCTRQHARHWCLCSNSTLQRLHPIHPLWLLQPSLISPALRFQVDFLQVWSHPDSNFLLWTNIKPVNCIGQVQNVQTKHPSTQVRINKTLIQIYIRTYMRTYMHKDTNKRNNKFL